MSLAQRLRRIEKRLDKLEANDEVRAQNHETLLTALEADEQEEQEPERDLDGNVVGAEREPGTPL